MFSWVLQEESNKYIMEHLLTQTTIQFSTWALQQWSVLMLDITIQAFAMPFASLKATSFKSKSENYSNSGMHIF